MREAFVQETARARAWLEGWDPRGKGLALFSCAPRGLWQTHVLSVDVDDHRAFDPRPDVAPLLDVLDEYERFAVALVDKEARIFVVFAGEIEETDVLKDFVPARHDQGGLSQANYQRHHEAHVFRHLKRVVEHLAHLLRRRRGGPAWRCGRTAAEAGRGPGRPAPLPAADAGRAGGAGTTPVVIVTP